MHTTASIHELPACEKVGYWGYHLILDCQGCAREKIACVENLRNFVKALVEEIDMKAYGEPALEHFATHDADKAGYSLVQLIETSSITGHFVDKNGDAYLDIFSCKPFSIDVAKSVVTRFFDPQKIKVHYLTRQA
jgi:S-adenosylmethionine/arginine decarboxylase-like enzyme